MKNKEKFSIKKFLLAILCSVIVSIFIGNTILFAESCTSKFQTELLEDMDKNNQILIDFGKTAQPAAETLQKKIIEDKINYGEDYPSEGIYLYLIMNKFSSNRIIDIYLLSFLIGVVTGILIYIIAIQKASIKKATIELLISFIIVYLVFIIINFGYGFLLTNMLKYYNSTVTQDSNNITYIYDLYNLNIENMVFIYLIIGFIVFIVNTIRQKILTYKLNRQLHTQESNRH